MAYFVIQVRSGKEIEAKEMLKSVLLRSGDSMVKTIYAMETFTEIVRMDDASVDLSELKTEDISDHLYVKRIQVGLSNLRTACNNLKEYKDANSLALLADYKDSIRELSKQLRAARNESKKISSVISGYILIELNVDFHYFPDNLWHLVKSLPNVAGIPSKHNIPQEEVDAFFHQVDVTPEVELQFEELLSSDEIMAVKDELLHEATRVIGTTTECEFIENIELVESALVDSVADTILKTDSTGPIKSLLERCKVFVRRKRQTIIMPSTLYLSLYNEIEMQSFSLTAGTLDFLQRLKTWAYQQNVVRIE